jgi:hypothetical protein
MSRTQSAITSVRRLGELDAAGRGVKLQRKLLRGLTSTFTLGTLAAIAGWHDSVASWLPVPGLDPSFTAAAYAATERGMAFGHEIVLTYGPLAFLDRPALWDQGLASLAFVFFAIRYLALGVSLVWALRRSLNGAVALLLAAIVLMAARSVDASIALATIWCLVAFSPDPPPSAVWLVTFGGALLGAVETLAQVREGPVILAICALTLAFQERRTWRPLFIFVACSGLAIVTLWLVSGQAIDDLPGYGQISAQIASGYSEAMVSLEPPGAALPAALLVGALLIVTAAIRSRSGRTRLAAAAVMALSSFALFKEAFVRSDYVHKPIFFATAVALASALSFGRRRLLTVGVVGALLAVYIQVSSPPDLAGAFNPITGGRQAVDEAKLLFSPGQRSSLSRVGHLFLVGTYRLDPATLRLLRGHTVHIDPWEAAVAYTYRLDWHPLPVFQNYDAYTSTFDRLNSQALQSSNGPQRILRENTVLVDPGHVTGVDTRLPAWDPPGQTIAMFCNYAELRTTPRWQVLTKVADRCSRPALIRSVDSAYGSVVAVPSPPAGDFVEAAVRGVGISGIERVRTLLFRAHVRQATVNGDRVYRLVPGTAGDGLLMNIARGLDYPAPFGLSPGARTLEITGESGRLRFDFYRIRVSRGGAAQ